MVASNNAGREPDQGPSHKTDRDVFNEKPSHEEQTIATAQPTKTKLGTAAILRTALRDVQIKLFPELVLKSVGGFVAHSRNGGYDDALMMQTEDPLGDGAGGTSIWGKEFEDELHPDLNHYRPYTVSMANNKHTVFGRAVTGMDPFEVVKSLNIEIR
ncbi:MAG: cyclophilin-like domain-containing protein [Linnemannia gamsii]|nr:MAG: cyclophilin-like domain-containing protein [Linnemannia gamsii]